MPTSKNFLSVKKLWIFRFFYQLVAVFPKEEKFGLSSQIQRCAVSIASNIAEGCGRTTDNDFKRFLSIAMGSSFELETQVVMALKLNYLCEQQMTEFEVLIKPVQKMLFGLYNKIENNNENKQR